MSLTQSERGMLIRKKREVFYVFILFWCDYSFKKNKITRVPIKVEEKKSTYEVLNGLCYRNIVGKKEIGTIEPYADSVFLLENDLEKYKELLKEKYQKKNENLKKRIQDNNNKIIQLCE